jgi:hypothetical protein
MRTDVSILTLPLLGADWYAAEVGRRWGLGELERVRGSRERLLSVVAAADSQGMVVAASLAVDGYILRDIGGCWTVTSVVLIRTSSDAEDPACDGNGALLSREQAVRVDMDTAAVRQFDAAMAEWLAGREPKRAFDSVTEQMVRLLRCPGQMLAAAVTARRDFSLDSLCNSR